MLKRLAVLGAGLVFFSASYCSGQLCTTTHKTDLYCLLPTAFQTPAFSFDQFYTPFGTELSQLPVAKPAGLTLTFENGRPTETNESLGPVFSGRAETIGRNRLYVGETFQHFGFNRIDGISLGAVPIILSCPQPNCTVPVVTATNNRFDIKASQYTFLAAYGVTDRLDVSVTVPVERIAMSVFVNGSEIISGNSVNFTEYVPGTSSGFGDVIVGGKYTVLDLSSLVVSGGVDLRLPTGDEMNFLGSGTTGVRPYLAFSKHGRFSPHLNVGYQWNGNSILNANTQGQKQQLPTEFFYSIGADGTVSKNLTFVVDILGHRYFDAPRFDGLHVVSTYGISVMPVTESYTHNDLSLGLKGRAGRLVFTGNALIRMDGAGLRSNVVPLAGVSYTFR